MGITLKSIKPQATRKQYFTLPRQIISKWGRWGSGVYIFSWTAINLQREKQKSNVSQLSSIVVSQAANIRNNMMEMALLCIK